MKLHIPTALRRALLKAMAVSLFVTTGSASAWTPKDDLGNTMFVGDSITNGAYLNLHSWRWEMHKIFTDNGISYDEVGVMDGDNKGGSMDMRYGDSVFLNRHASQNSARAYEIAERKQKLGQTRFGGTGIQHWLGLAEPSGWSGSSVEGYRLEDVDKPVNTFFLMIGTNDTLSDYATSGIGANSNLETVEQNLLGLSNGTYSGNGDMDTIVNAMIESSAQAEIIILGVPVWGNHSNNNADVDHQAMASYNKALGQWAAQQKNASHIKFIDPNAGILDVTDAAGRGVDSMFQDHLHPNAQGELLLAGNVAKGLGYAGRTAGQVRKAATEFSLKAEAIHTSASKTGTVTYDASTGLTFTAGSTLTGNWGSAPEGGFTLEFHAGSIGNGATAGWDTNTGLTVSVGDGTHSGSLTLNEAYIQWGDTILYSMDMSTLSDAIRIAYIRGNNSLGLATGFYVWLGDQLIGEALSVGSESLSGVEIGNTTSGEITLSELAMDSTGSWAPDSNGVMGDSLPTIEPASASSYTGWPGVQDWPGTDKMVEDVQTLTGGGLSSSLFTDGKTGCNVILSGSQPSIIANWSGVSELFVTVQEGSSPTSWVILDNLNGGNSTANLHVRFSGDMTLPTIFCALQNEGTEAQSHYHDGDIYVEFSGNLTVDSAKFSTNNEDEVYANHVSVNGTNPHNPAVSSFYTGNSGTKKEKGAVNGKITYVFNNGTFNGRILGGEAYGVDGEEVRVTKGVEIYLNGGTFNGDIYAGGTIGYIGGAKITITGGRGAMTFADTVQRISAGGFGLNNKGGVKDGGTAEVVLENLTDTDGFVNWSGELSGGRIVEGSNVTRTLTLNNVVLTSALKATLAEFDKVTVDKGSEVTLKQLGGATELEIGSESTLTLTAENGGGSYTDMTTLNSGKIVLESGVSYTTQTAAISDDQIAESTTGVYDVKDGAALVLNAGVNANTQAKEVRGSVEVQLREGGTLTLGDGAADAPNDAVSLSKLVLSGGNSTLNVTGAWTLKGLEGSTASKLTIGGTNGSLAFSMESSLSGPVTLHFGSGVNYSGALRIDAGGATANSHVLLEIGDILNTLAVVTRAGGGLTVELTGLSDKDLTWAGFQLFSTGETTALTDPQITALEGLLSGDFAEGSKYSLGVRADGTVFLQRETAGDLTWQPGSQSSPTWAEGNATTWETSETDMHFASGDNVFFAKLDGEERTTVTVSGTVHPGNITVGADGTAANYTFNAAAGNASSVDIAGTVTLWSGSEATFNVPVTFSGTGTITGSGTLAFGGTGTVTASGLVVGNGVTVEVSTSGTKNFGGIEVQEGGRFVVQAANGWDKNGNKVHGDGTLVLDTHSGWDAGFFDYFVSNATEGDTRTLHTLELAEGTGMAIGTDGKNKSIANIQEIRVKNGAGLSVDALAMGSPSLTLYLSGDGATSLAGEGTAGTDNGKLASEAAFSIWNYGWTTNPKYRDATCAWSIKLEDEAAIAAGGVSNSDNHTSDHIITVDGNFDAHGNKLTKLGVATLKLAHMQAGADHAGSITVNGGTLEISGLAEGAGQETKVATTVDLQESDGTGTFKVSGGGNYGVDKVVFGQGTEAANTASLESTAVLETAEGTKLTVAGNNNVSLDFTNGAGIIKGPGTVALTGTVTGTGAMGIDSATVEANAAWSGYTGGLYLSNSGTLQLGADIEVGYLGGTSDGYGGSITASDATGRTITVTVGNGEAKGVNVGEHVTLKIGDGKTQNLINLAGGGTLELGAGATSTVSGTSSIGSITNAGTLNLYKDTEQVTLTVNGNVTTKGAGIIVLGTGGTTSNDASTFTVNGNLELNGKSAVLGSGQSDSLYIQRGTVTVTGQISGTTKGEDGTLGRIRMGGGTLVVEGSGDAAWDGYLMLCNTSTVRLGTDAAAGKLTVGGIDGSWNGKTATAQAQVQGNGELVLNVAENTTANGNVGSGLYGLLLVVSEKAHLTKAGKGTQVLSALKTEGNDAYVEVTDGILQFKTDNAIPERTVFDVRDLRVTGPGVLDFVRQNFTKVDGSNNITLSNGGTLRSSYSGTANAEYNFGSLTLGANGGKIKSSGGATGMQSFSFDSLQGEGNLDLSAAFGGTSDATKHSLNLGHIKGYTGTVSANSLDDYNVLSIDGGIEAGAAGTTGSITVTHGAVTLNGDDAVLKKSGEGAFSISGLKVSSGQGLQMDYTGGALSITHLTLEGGARLNYSAAAAEAGAQLVELAFSDFVALFGSADWSGTIDLVTEDIDRGGDFEELYLGITAESGEIANWGEETLKNYFTDDYTGKGAELLWKEEGGKQKLYLSLLNTEESVRYWDGAWDDGSGPKDGTRGNGPNNKLMEAHAALWYSTDESGNATSDCAWSQMGHRDDSTDFTESTLQLGGDEGKWSHNGMNYVRLGKGSSSDTSRLTVLGGKLYADGATGDKLSSRVYISLWAPEAEHFHLLVGGSSFVGSDVTTSGGLGFSGNTHIQVQGGTVDHIVGGNHVTNSAATFTGNTYISVYEGGSAHNEEGVPDMENLNADYGTNVRGGIVGGSTVTATSGNLSGETKTYDFLGHSHIFIYTVLKSADALPISDGDNDPDNDVLLYNVVGGNAWIGLMPTATQSMVFSGSSNIAIDLTHYQNFYHENAARGGLTFEKAIVGGNYSSTGASSESGGTQTRGTVFEYNSQGEAADHPYASQIEITGTTNRGESITFLGGINGASRRDSTGDGTTTFTATGSKGILLDLVGGVYRNYVAGGFWFGGSRYGEGSGKGSSYTGTLTSDITVNLNGGEYWRVIGGSVNFDASDQSSCTTTGNTVVTVEGAVEFGMAVQGQSDTQGTQPTQENLGLLLGGSLYSDTRGTFVQEGSTTLNVLQGTFDNTHIVAGDYMVYTDSDEKTNSASITGGTNLTLGGGGVVTVASGIVVAGSYLSDAGKGGSISVGRDTETQAAEDVSEGSESVLATQVTVEEGVELNPMANHKVVLVGGNLLLDGGVAGSQGEHMVSVKGDTQITVNGGTINGFIVGGSYTDNSTTGQNTLETTGTIHIDIKGGTVNGNIIGGHFSENTGNPDKLILHDVNITMSGGTVTGYIFGGSFRKATSSLGEGAHPTQGDILIQLTGGTIEGGVYAAGNHYNTAGGADLHVRTNSTRVEIGSGVKLGLGSHSGDANQYIVISGGYLRSSDAATRANDYSTVGYDENAKTWADECAVLSFTDAPSAYTHLTDTELRFQDFDAVEVQSGKLELNASQLLVLHKAAAKGEFGNDSFAKMGAGSLVLGKGLGSFLGQDVGDVTDFTGKIILEGGTLTLGGGKAQSLAGGLQVDMFNRTSGNKNDAYLQAFDESTSFNGLTTTQKTTIELVYKDPSGQQTELPQLQVGVYYIVDGLDATGVDAKNLNSYIDLQLWEGAKKESYQYDLELRGDNNEKLVLRVHKDDPDEWRWEGGEEGNVWKPVGDTTNWTHDKLEAGDESYRNDTYYFDAGAAESGDVFVASGIEAGAIHVESGQYRFMQQEGAGADYTGLSVTILEVGSQDGGGELADVELALPTSRLDTVVLYDNSRFAIGHKDAIQGNTKLEFKGEGILKYAEASDGKLAFTGDLSDRVSGDSIGTVVLHIQVGNGALDSNDVVRDDSEQVVWSGGTSAKGIEMVVKNGLVKTGRKAFRLSWTPDSAKDFAGTLEAQEGEFILEAGGDATIAGGTDAKLLAKAGATLKLQVKDGSTLTVSRAARGDGEIRIGSADEGANATIRADAASSQGYILDTAVADDFTGTIALEGNSTSSTVLVKDIAALGNKQSTLALEGRAIMLDGAAGSGTPATISVKAITVEGINYVGGYGAVSGNANKAITLAATEGITGDVNAVLANADGYTHVLEGDLSGFIGTVSAGANSTWTLTGEVTPTEDGTPYTVAAALAGTGKVIVNNTTPKKVRLAGDIRDSVSIENQMTDTSVVLVGQNNSSDGELIFNGNEIWLGDEDGTASSWAGTRLAVGSAKAGGTFRLRSGKLENSLTGLNGISLVVDTAKGATVDVGKTQGSQLDEIIVNANGRMSNVEGDISVGDAKTAMQLYFGMENVGDAPVSDASKYLINFAKGGAHQLTIEGVKSVNSKDVDFFTMDFDSKTFVEVIKKHRRENVKSFLHVTAGGELVPVGDGMLDAMLSSGSYSGILSTLGFIAGVEGGDLTLLGSSKDVYLVIEGEGEPDYQGNPHRVTSENKSGLVGKKAVLLDENQTLSLSDTGEVTLNNLVGLDDSRLEVTGDCTVTLNNSRVEFEEGENDWMEAQPEPGIDREHLESLKGTNTEFNGTIVGVGTAANFVKTGAGTLTVGSESGTGGMDIDGTLTLKEGDVVLRGDATEDGSRLGGLTFSYANGEGGGLTVQGARLTVDDITVEEGSDPDSNNVDITENGELVYGGKNGGVLENLHLKSSDESGTLSTDGTLTLGSGSDITGLDVRLDAQQSGDEQQGTGGKLVLQDDAEMHARAVELGDKGQLELSGSTGKHTVESLSGTAGSTLSGGAGTDLTVTGTGGNFSGTLSGGGKLTVAKDAEFTLENVTTDAPDTASAWGIDVQSGGTFTLDTSEQHGDAGPRFGDVVFAGGSDVTLKFDYNADGGTTAHMNSLTFGDGSSLTLESTSESPYTGNPDRIVIGYAANGEEVTADVDITLKGVSFLHFEADEVHYDSRTGEYYVGTKQVSRNLFAAALPHREKNAMAGAELFWSASSPESPALKEALKNPLASDLLRMLAGLTAMKDSGNASGLARALAAGAGASISVLGPALAEDIHRQLMSIRSRATGVMDDMQTDGYDAYPFWHAWITGEGGYRKLDADGFAPGYTLNNWGGSVGADATLSQRTSVGLAITAMYGDLKPEASDSATGDLDTVYLSGYLRHASGAWSHTFALSMGVSDIKLDRTVTYGMGSYRTHGNTDGLSFGVLYEIGYSRYVNKSGSFVLQPIANVELRHAMINGYTETGSDAGLQVDDIEQTVLTFGAGVRVQGLIGQQTFNHDALVEARALVKADVGDRSGTSRHAIIRDTTHAEVESAEVGAVGVETGVGLSIPLGLNAGSIILDGSVEFRSGWTSANASVGYRISF